MGSVKDFEELTIFQNALKLSKMIYLVTNREGFNQIIALCSRYVLLLVP